MLCLSLITILLVMSVSSYAQRPDTNYDESKVVRYTLPDPLTLQNGERVRDTGTWLDRRRPEILELFRSQVYGRSPGRPEHMSFDVTSAPEKALGGIAVRKEVTVHFTGAKGGPRMHLLIYLPAASTKPAPVFLGWNFTGNVTVDKDPGIPLGEVWERQQKKAATEEMRGANASRWPISRIVERGYGVVTAYYFDIEPDFDGGIGLGVRPLFFKPGQKEPAPDDWGAIAAWAWALSRAMDYLETDPAVDAKRVIVHGHSRLGKAALWAGAEDTRFAMVISNDSGEGGAALSRRNFGETVADLNRAFPHWFCGNYKQYSGRAETLPVDQHMLLALIAPRPLYVASAEEDQWADPKGEFLSAVAAGPEYALFGKEGLGTDQMPEIEKPIQHTVAYHIRSGKHDITAYDWEQYLSFADRYLK